MKELRACSGCRRHVAIAERACPFCATVLEPLPASQRRFHGVSRAAIFASATLAGSACWSGPPPAVEKPATGDRPTSDTATLQGTLTDSRTGQPLAGYPVEVTSATHKQRATTDASGSYVLAKLPPGNYMAVFGFNNHPRRRAPEVPVTLVAGQSVRLDQAIYTSAPSDMPMPYGAPPARARLV